MIDPAQMENALLNLCVNARDALPGGGTITVETSNVTLDEGAGLDPDLPPGTYLSIRVVDNGIGMSEETLTKACEPFFTTKPTGAGTGLGLSMIYGFAKQSHGQMKIESELGKGTQVYLQLPTCADPVQPQPIVGITEAPPVGEGETVLVVDDEPSVRMFVSEVLGSLGYVVIEAEDSQEGLQWLCSDTRIDLLVTDIGLPGGLDGREMAEKARERRPGLPVLFMTGYVEPQILDDLPLGPAMAAITKPFSLDVFRMNLCALLQEALSIAKGP